MTLENRGANNSIPLPKYLAATYEKMLPMDKKIVAVGSKCSYCDMRMDVGLILRNCDHSVHKGCLEDMFRLKKNKCQICEKVIADGYDRAL